MRTRITFMGESRWSAHLAEGLGARYSDAVECNAVELDGHRRGLLEAASHLFRDDIIVRVGFPPPALSGYPADARADDRSGRERIKRVLFRNPIGRALRRIVLFARLSPAGRQGFYVDSVQRLTRWVRPRRRDFLYWIGTDVLNAIDATHEHAPRYLHRVRRFQNITGVQRLTDELEEIGVDARTVPYPPRITDPPGDAAPMPLHMTVLTYVPDSRRDFYGLPVILEAARALPELSFMVMGGTGGDVEALPNVRFTGFVDDPRPLYDQASVVVRHVQHDGAGYSMAEGLIHGRQVIYTYDVPHTIRVPFGDTDGLIRTLRSLKDQSESGGIPLNRAGREWAIKEFDVDRRFSDLLDALLGPASAPPR